MYLAIGEFITIYVATVGYIYTGEHITSKIREHYLAACLRQNIGFYDKLGAGEIATRITADTNIIQDGISEKVGLTLTAVATFVTAFGIGFYEFWKLTAILSCVVIAIILVVGVGSRFQEAYNEKALSAYAAGGTIAEEVISSIRNATAFGTQQKLAKQYDAHLDKSERPGFIAKLLLGCMIGGTFFVIYLNYGLAFWQASLFLTNDETSLSRIMTIILAIIMGAFSLGNVSPNLNTFTLSMTAAAKIFDTIDRVSPIDPASTEGKVPQHLNGTIELRNIKHIYPSRPDVVVMDDVSLVIPAGKKTALVGSSGSGKSTIVGLLERFYEPVSGEILLDGCDISMLNLNWLRSQISLVGQEPTLFATTIFQNIAFGLRHKKFENQTEHSLQKLVIEAAKMANAHDFVMNLPEKYNTQVGERGFLLSGGQKQRIAIARALVCDPKILLLDEATSALDTVSEALVQDALEIASVGRTTITIAHRLSTIKDADNIVVMAEGKVLEQGTHDELLAKEGAYFKLVDAQKLAQVKEVSEKGYDQTNAKVNLRTKSKDLGHHSNSPSAKEIISPISESESISDIVPLEDDVDLAKKYSLWAVIKTIMAFNKEEWPWMVFGLFWSIICGCGNPAQSVFFAKQVVNFSAFSNLQPIDEVRLFIVDTATWF